MKKILTVSLGALLIATAANADIASVDYVTGVANSKQDASTAVEVTTAGTAVGSATVPVYVNASGVVAPITSYAGNAATATKATQDASGNVITTTYATKTELAGKQDKLTIDSALNTSSTNPVQNMVVAKALKEKQAVLGYTPEDSANKVTTATGLTASSTDTQYPSGKLVYTAVNGKQDKLTTSNIKGSNGVSVGISNGVITVTGTTYSTGTDTKSGLTKLYPEIGSNTDGTMTQSAIKAALGSYATKTGLTTGLNSKQDLVANGTDGNFYVADYKSAWGDMFTLMPKDPKCDDPDVKCALTHENGKYGWEIVRE